MAAVRQKGSQPHPSAAGSQPDAHAADLHHAHFNRALQRPLPTGQPPAPASAKLASQPTPSQASLSKSGSKQPASSAAVEAAFPVAGSHSQPTSAEALPAPPTAPNGEPSSARKRTKQDVAAHRQGLLSTQDAADGRGDKRQKAAVGQDTSALGSAAAPIAVSDSDEEDRPLCSFANFNAFQRPSGQAALGRPGAVPPGSLGQHEPAPQARSGATPAAGRCHKLRRGPMVVHAHSARVWGLDTILTSDLVAPDMACGPVLVC